MEVVVGIVVVVVGDSFEAVEGVVVGIVVVVFVGGFKVVDGVDVGIVFADGCDFEVVGVAVVGIVVVVVVVVVGGFEAVNVVFVGIVVVVVVCGFEVVDVVVVCSVSAFSIVVPSVSIVVPMPCVDSLEIRYGVNRLGPRDGVDSDETKPSVDKV